MNAVYIRPGKVFPVILTVKKHCDFYWNLCSYYYYLL